MANYCVNKNAQSNGDHEVHNIVVGTEKGCLPDPANRLALGEHQNCSTAVQKAKQSYTTANGCFYCASACHTT